MGTVYFYNSDTGSIISEPSILSGPQTLIPGWHGPFNSKALAIAFYTQNVKTNPTDKAPAGVAGNLANEGGQAASAVATLTGAAAFLQPVTTFLHDVTSASFWERVGEVVLGLILVSVGVAHITRAVPIATAIAKKAGMAAALA